MVIRPTTRPDPPVEWQLVMPISSEMPPCLSGFELVEILADRLTLGSA